MATAIALLIYFRRDWVRIIGGFFTSIRDRRVRTEDQRLAWMIILATIPVGIVGPAVRARVPGDLRQADPRRRSSWPSTALILLAGERYRSRASKAADAAIAARRAIPRLIPAREPELAGGGRQPGRAATPAPGPGDPRQQEQAEASRPTGGWPA